MGTVVGKTKTQFPDVAKAAGLWKCGQDAEARVSPLIPDLGLADADSSPSTRIFKSALENLRIATPERSQQKRAVEGSCI